MHVLPGHRISGFRRKARIGHRRSSKICIGNQNMPTSPLSNQSEKTDEQAHWLEVGQTIFESVPTEMRPKWAAEILRASLSRSGIPHSAFKPVLECATRKSDWKKAHDVFSRMRKKTLALESSPNLSDEKHLLLRNLYLAENVAKVIYNGSNPPDPFDEDSGWWITLCLKSILDSLNRENVPA
jgi:hypothetical protein